MTTSEVRVRFSPSPTGTPHVGMVRTALFNWAYARHTGGTMIFRIEDTDAQRDSEESYQAIIDALEWLGLDWDEGPQVGGPHGPYRQSMRGDIYRDVVQQLLDAGEAYEAFSTNEEVQERRRAKGKTRSSATTTMIATSRRRRRKRSARKDANLSFACGCPTKPLGGTT